MLHCRRLVGQSRNSIVNPGRCALNLLQVFLRRILWKSQHQACQESYIVQDLCSGLMEPQRFGTFREFDKMWDQRRVQGHFEGHLRGVAQVKLGASLKMRQHLEGEGYGDVRSITASSQSLKRCFGGSPTAHIITKRANKPPNPRLRYPPLSLIISLRPLKWAVRSLMLPQYHSFSIICITAAIASSVVDRCVWMCSFNTRMARYLCIIAALLSPTRGSVSYEKHADVYIAVWMRRLLLKQKGTYCFMYRLDAMSGSPSKDALNREMRFTTCEP